MARFGSAVIAFAVAAAIVTRAALLPEFLVQAHDPNILGGGMFDVLLHRAGYAVVLGFCAALAAAAVMLVGWRTRLRGASDWHATLASALFAACLTPWLGVSLQPVGWICCAAACLLLDRDDDRSLVEFLGVLLIWSLLQGGATLAGVLAICAFAGRLADDRAFTPAVRRRGLFAAIAVVVGGIQLHALPWLAYGAHALYLDALRAGAPRDAIWTHHPSAPALGFSAILVIAAWYGVRRRERSADAFTFFALLVLALADARNLPYFAIAAAPVAVDALASYYVNRRTAPRTSTLHYAPAFLAAAFAFMSIMALTEPKVTVWPPALEQPGALLKRLAATGAPHRLLCTQPRWCDGAHAAFSRIATIADDRTGTESTGVLHEEHDVATASGTWRRDLTRAGIDAVIASRDDSIVALLRSSGWQVGGRDSDRVLLVTK